MNGSGILPWSDNWWLEGNKAWFIIGARNILCCLNISDNECEVMVKIPDTCTLTSRSISHCMKYQNDVYCFPVNGKNIWVYSIENDQFFEITLENMNTEALEMHDFWEFGGEIFVISIKLGQIFEINTKKKKIENRYVLCEEGNIARSVKVGSVLYCLSGTFERIYRFDLATKEIIIDELPGIGRKYNTICFDGENFWLGGFQEEIYMWNKKKNIIDIYRGFGKGDLYITDDADCMLEDRELPDFLFLVSVGKYSWFIPSKKDEIIYADRKSHILCTFKIDEDSESEKGQLVSDEFTTKYILEYVRDNRYIGLFSIKNMKMVEIDTEDLIYRWCNYSVGGRSLKKYVELVDYVLYEGNVWDKEVYKKILV